MLPEDKRQSPEREETDESLRIERQKTDQALFVKQASLEDEADAVVDRARKIADAVLNEARDKADQKLDQEELPLGTRETLGEERAVEDAALQRERTAADESLRREREAYARALHKLLPFEREKTDRHLLTERARSDFAIANRDDFLGIVSHDLRNLIQGIVVSADLLSSRAADDEAGRQVLAGDRRGLGLGLYISRCIVEAHGGTIWAESKAGGGSRLYFTLPIATRSDTPPS